MKNYFENLNWRYATKKFDPSKKVSEEGIKDLQHAIQLSPSSYGLQPYQVIVIKDEELKKKLRPAAFDQPQVTDSSHLFVFANLTHVNEAYVDTYLKNIAETRDMDIVNLKGLKEMLQNTILKMSPEKQSQWAAKQTYIALGNFLSAAAEFKIDVCPMEGFDAQKFDDILNLSEKGLTTAVIATVGYRSEEDKLPDSPKVRKAKKDLFHQL